MKIRGNGLKANTPRPATINNDHSKIEKESLGFESDDEKCKHGKWTFNCYDGCHVEKVS